MTALLLVEDGSLVANANSYVTVEEADDYLMANIKVFPTWDALVSTDKEALLVWASRYLDQRAIWNGEKVPRPVGDMSALRWPRSGVYDIDGILIPSDVIPYQLKEVTIEMARYLMVQDRAVERDTDGLTRIRVDVIEMYFNKDYRLPEIPNELNVMIAGLGFFQSGGVRFARIRKA